jgi:hypothetical protein
MARVIVELVPTTLVLKSNIKKDETTTHSASAYALINELGIDCPEEKTLGIDLNDHINSWCRVHLEIYAANDNPDDSDLPDTCAKLYHHADGQGVVMEEYPGGGFTLNLRLDNTAYRRIIETANNQKLRTVVECNAWFKHSIEERTILSEETGTWCARFESIELCIGEVDKVRWPLSGLIGRKLAEFEKTIPKEERGINRREFSYYLAKSVGEWAISKPVSRNSVVTELDEAFEIAGNIREWSIQEIGSEIHRYIKKPWATSGHFERKLMQSMVCERIDELLQEIKNQLHTSDVAILKRHYRIAEIPKIPKYGAAIDFFVGLALGIIVGISNGWAIGITAALVYLSIADIKSRIDRTRFPTADDGSAALIRDLEHTKNMLWHAEERSICPRYIRQRLEEMENRGVGWYGGTLDIAHHAEARNPNVWD